MAIPFNLLRIRILGEDSSRFAVLNPSIVSALSLRVIAKRAIIS